MNLESVLKDIPIEFHQPLENWIKEVYRYDETMRNENDAVDYLENLLEHLRPAFKKG